MRNYALIYSFLILPLFPSAAVAFEIFDDGHFQGRISAGTAHLSADDAALGITAYETDTVHFDDEDAAIASIGVGYVWPLCGEDCESGELQWLPEITTSIDGAYQFETTFSGEVWLYEDVTFNDYHNEMQLQNANLMFNVTLGVVEYECWSFFVLGGLGAAWTWVEYSDERNDSILLHGDLNLDTQTNTTFAFQGGAGIGLEIMPELDLTLTYLYTDLGDVETSSNQVERLDPIDGLDVSAAEFNLRQQSLMLGLQLNFI